MGKEVYIFLKVIYPKVNALATLEFELAYFDVALMLATTPPEISLLRVVWFFNGISTFTVYQYLAIPPLGQDMTQGQFLSGV